MPERDRHIEEIQRLLASNQQTPVDRDVQRPKRKTSKERQEDPVIEEIRTRLEQGARTIVETYEAEAVTLRPEAEVLLRDVVVPWWSQLTESGIVEQLAQFRGGKSGKAVPLNDPIRYPRPGEVQAELKSGERPFKSDAERLLKIQRGIPIFGDAITRADAEDGILDELEGFAREEWTSKLYLPRPESRYLGFSGLDIFSWPSEDLKVKFIRWGMYGMGRKQISPTDERRERTQLDLQGEAPTLPAIHPGVVIQFSQQVTSGRVWERIEAALGGKK